MKKPFRYLLYSCVLSTLILFGSIASLILLRIDCGLELWKVHPVKSGLPEVGWTAVHWIGFRNLAPIVRCLPGYSQTLFSAQTVSRRSGPCLALTFDDALGKNATSFLSFLDFLKDQSILATFFVIADENSVSPHRKTILKEVADRGHEIGNHGLRDEFMHMMSLEEFDSAMTQWEDGIRSALHEWPRSKKDRKWFRAPRGMMSSSMDNVLRKRGYSSILTDIYSDDWLIDDRDFHSSIIKHASRDGSVVVLHVMDEARVHRTVEILKDAIPALRKRGFSFLRLSDLFAPIDDAAPDCSVSGLCVLCMVLSLFALNVSCCGLSCACCCSGYQLYSARELLHMRMQYRMMPFTSYAADEEPHPVVELQRNMLVKPD